MVKDREETTTVEIYASDRSRLETVLEELRREFAAKHNGRIQLTGRGATAPNKADAFQHVLDLLGITPPSVAVGSKEASS